MERAFHQRKSQTAMKTKDSARAMDIAYQIGQSKAIRNAIVNALGVYCDFAFDEARNSIVEKIGKDIKGWIERTTERLKALPVDLKRVERVVGRAAKDWLAPDVARIVALGRRSVTAWRPSMKPSRRIRKSLRVRTIRLTLGPNQEQRIRGNPGRGRSGGGNCKENTKPPPPLHKMTGYLLIRFARPRNAGAMTVCRPQRGRFPASTASGPRCRSVATGLGQAEKE